jgi:hypothetical protein
MIVGLLLGDKLIFTPLAHTWKEHKDRIIMLTKSINNGEVLLSRERSIRERWDNMKNHALPPNIPLAESEVYSAVNQWTLASRFSLPNLKPTWKAADDYMTLEIQADGVGTMQSLARFLYELERDPLAIKIEDLTIGARDPAGKQLALSVRFTGLLLNVDQK